MQESKLRNLRTVARIETSKRSSRRGPQSIIRSFVRSLLLLRALALTVMVANSSERASELANAAQGHHRQSIDNERTSAIIIIIDECGSPHHRHLHHLGGAGRKVVHCVTLFTVWCHRKMAAVLL